MEKSFDDLFEDFFNRRKTVKKEDIPNEERGKTHNQIADIIKAIRDSRTVGLDGDIGTAIEKRLGPPDIEEKFTKDGIDYIKSIWNTEQGQFVKVAASIALEREPKKSLQERLEEAVEEEDWNLAIILRDRINKEKNKQNENNPKG